MAISEVSCYDVSSFDNEKMYADFLQLLYLRLSHPDESLQNPPFEQVYYWGDMKDLKNSQVTAEEFWKSREDIPPHLRGKVEFLSFDHPEIRAAMNGVTALVARMNRLKDIDKNVPDKLYAKYAELVDTVMGKVYERYLHIIAQDEGMSHLILLTLLRGGRRFEQRFGKSAEHIIRADVKRLNMVDGTVHVGIREWEGLEHIRYSKDDSIDLAVAEDCLASSVSVRSTVRALKELQKENTFPKMRKIFVFAAVGVQQGVEAFIEDIEALGIEVKVVCGDNGGRLNNNLYIERFKGEPITFRDSASDTYTKAEPYVGDMGENLTQHFNKKNGLPNNTEKKIRKVV